MGALHEGHLALIRKARELAGGDGRVIVSIFVNPTQFDRKDDLAAYPRPLQSDLEHCRALGVDLVFAPGDDPMYAGDHSTWVTERKLSSGLCGGSRPGHFDGVCTVVLKLFLLSGCQFAVFGEKDFQQLAVVRRMVRDLDVPVEIVSHPTVREADGLAMSSRNVRLSPEQRADAPRIHRALYAALEAGSSAEDVTGHAWREIEAGGLAKVDYVRLIDADTLLEIEDVRHRALLAAAVFYGEVRLIDHVVVNFPP